MKTYIKIVNGQYRGVAVDGKVFSLVAQFAQGAKGGYVTVANGGNFPGFPDTVKIKVDSPMSYTFSDEVAYLLQGNTVDADVGEVVSTLTDAEITANIKQRFEVLDKMTRAAINGDIRAMIVTGPPGVGKSYGVEALCDESSLFDKISGKKLRFEIMKGATSAVELYCTLYRLSEPSCVLVLDDCDTVFGDVDALNVLKAALDSGHRRRICWNKDSNTLHNHGVPTSFEFKGAVIFITNHNMDAQKPGKLKDQMTALQSRCHYLDLDINTLRDRCLRVAQVHADGELFARHDLPDGAGDEIMAFMHTNKASLREVSLRMAQKIADLVLVDPVNWKLLAINSCTRRPA